MLFFFMVSAMLVTNAFGVSNCPEGYGNEEGNKCYKKMTTAMNYDNAVAECIKEGGQLAKAADDNEFTAIGNTVDSNDHAWVAGKYHFTDDEWRDSDNVKIPFEKWNPAPPPGAGYCLVYNSGYHAQILCTDNKIFVCEAEKVDVCDDGWTTLSDVDKCVKAVKKHRKTFDDAKTACTDMSAVLATSVVSRNHRRAIASTIKFRDHFWIGYKDDGTKTFPDIINGQVVAQADRPFRKGRPRQDGPECVSFKMRWWFDKKCDKRHFYICEKPFAST